MSDDKLHLTMELTETRKGAQCLVAAALTFVGSDGKQWQSTVNGRGGSHADAVADLANAKLPKQLHGALEKYFELLDAQGSKAVELSVPPATNSEEVTKAVTEPTPPDLTKAQPVPAARLSGPVESLPPSPIASPPRTLQQAPAAEPPQTNNPSTKPQEVTQTPDGTPPEVSPQTADEDAF